MQLAVFLRAINVGTTNRVRMEALRGWLEEMGFPGAQTYLQTGNLILDASEREMEVARRIDAGLAGRGMKNATAVVRTKSELTALVGACPFETYPADAFRQLVTLWRDPIEPETAARLAAMPGVVLVRERELLTVTEIDVDRGTANTMAAVTRAVKAPGTARYWGVVRDVLSRMA